MTNLAESKINEIKNFSKKTLNNIVNQPDSVFFAIIIFIISAVIIFVIIIYIIFQISKKKDNIQSIDKSYTMYKSNTKSQEYQSINEIDNGNYNYPTRDGNKGKSTGRICDYFIASSYNSCCSGDFKDDYVDIEALKNAIKQGARVLDFQIFSINGDLIVSASDNETNFMKGTYNYLYLNGPNSVFDIINKYAFSSFCPNNKDPLFINLRIQSEKLDIYDTLTTIVKDAFIDRLLDPIYGYEGEKSGININKKPIYDFLEKIIIICDQESKNFRNTPFHAYVNLSPNNDGGELISYKNFQVNFSEERKNIINKTKNKIVMVYPDDININNNRNPDNLFSMGCSIIFMNYQKLDDNLIKYLNTFGTAQDFNITTFRSSAFMLKKESLRDDVEIVYDDNKKECTNIDSQKLIFEIIYQVNTNSSEYNGYRIKIPISVLTFDQYCKNFITSYLGGTSTSGKELSYLNQQLSCSNYFNSGNTVNIKVYHGGTDEKIIEDSCYGVIGKCTYGNMRRLVKAEKDGNGNYFLNLDTDKKILIKSEIKHCDDVGDDAKFFLHYFFKVITNMDNYKWEQYTNVQAP